MVISQRIYVLDGTGLKQENSIKFTKIDDKFYSFFRFVERSPREFALPANVERVPVAASIHQQPSLDLTNVKLPPNLILKKVSRLDVASDGQAKTSNLMTTKKTDR